jgi:alpha-L-fucosidase
MPNEIYSTDSTRLKWYLDAKFGLFIHWGAYSVAGAEASWPIMAPRLSEAMFDTPSTISENEYIRLPEKFNPKDFDANEWVRTAQDAGLKYIIITAKHHDGFCMFDAPGTDYKITNTPFGRDVCHELADACHAAGMKLGFYYSPPDMHHPGYRDTSKPSTKNWLGEPKRKEWSEYLDYMESHIQKLLTDYGEISIIWFDGLCNHEKYDTPRFHKLIHELNPNTLINDRLGDGYDYVTPEQFIPKAGIPVKSGKPPSGNGIESEKFFRTVLTLFKIPLIKSWVRKQMHRYADGTLNLSPMKNAEYPSPVIYQPWETCMTLGQTWAYNPNETKWKTSGQLIKNLSTVAGHGGNYLLNVGPSELGNFPEEAIERLTDIGIWMKENSNAVYGTSYTPFSSMDWGTTTVKDNKLFLHIHEAPENNIISINNFTGSIKSVYSMSDNSLEYSHEDSRLEISLPKASHYDVLVITVEMNSTEPLAEYTKPKPLGKPLKDYIKSNAVASALINGIANGLIALFTYRLVNNIPAVDAAIDVLITIAIISFLTSWLVVGGTRKDIANDKVAVESGTVNESYSRKPVGSALKGLMIMLVCTLVLGGIISMLVILLLPGGFSGWGYILFKTIYTALTGSLAVFISIKEVIREKKVVAVR